MTLLSNTLAGLVSAIAILRSAGAVAWAAENQVAPRPADLRRLGINPRSFTSIGHG